MKLAIERWVQERRTDDTLGEHKSFDAYRAHPAWVLLGDPGAGKTSTFEDLAAREGGTKVSASEFLDLDRPEGYPEPIFIDGLDEAAAMEGKTPIGRIRSKLQRLGTPRFRLSCREADWRGSADSTALQQLVGRDNFAELHLAPLDTAQSVAFTRHWLQGTEAEAENFIQQARHHDLDGLLANPQTLRMLVDAVGSQPDNWPTSKEATYARACEKLVREQNPEHLAAQRDSACTDAQMLEAAGYLCAVLLLSASTSMALQRPPTPQPHVLELAALASNTAGTPELAHCRAALRTHLFMGDALGNTIPVHRTVAEYLGARYLAQRLQAGLPAKRVLALLQGEDGGVVPELRGLHAWLAVLAPDSVRASLIDHDPLGLVLHGDVLKFSTQEKVHLLQALQQEATRYAHFRSQNWASRPFGALATPDMQEHFRAWLQSPDRSATHQAVLDCVLDAMEHGQAMPALMPELEMVIRDKTFWPGLRRSAVHALCDYANQVGDWNPPMRVIEDIRHNTIVDDNNNLLGALLRHLYPKVIPAKNLWNYYSSLPNPNPTLHWEFWRNLATRYAPRADLPVLMDALLASNIRLKSAANQRNKCMTIGTLLQEAITHFGESVSIERMYQWLRIGLGDHSYNCLDNSSKLEIANWLTAHPARYQQLLKYSIQVLETSTQPAASKWYEISNLLCRATPPIDAQTWYLELADSRANEDDLRKILIREAISLTEHRDGADAALTLAALWQQRHPLDAAWLNTHILSCTYPPRAEDMDWINGEIDRKKRERSEEAEEIAFLGKELPLLTSSVAHLGLISHLGDVFLNIFHSSQQATPRERLCEDLFDNPLWAEMALAGLRHFLLNRTDLPSVDEIVSLHLQSHRYNAASPCLASMELRYADDPSTAFELEEALLEKLVAFRLTSNYGNAPAWFTQLVSTKPDLVARVMLQLMHRQIAAKKEHIESLYALAHDPQYAAIAQRITPELVKALQARASTKQLGSVRLLVSSFLRAVDHPTQLTLIKERLALPGLDVAQRVYWLTAGMQMEPSLYLPQLRSYIGTNQKRAAHVYDLMYEQRQERTLTAPLTLDAQTYLVELLGSQFTPVEKPMTGKAYWVTPAMESMRFVQNLISSMAADPSEQAASALSALLQNQRLKPWNEYLQQAAYEQRLLRCKALFQPPTVAQVCHTLANRQPANAADLHALALDHLTRLAQEIRNGNTNDCGQYWDGDKPHLENDCRDRLLSDLKKLLTPTGVNAEPEGHYADHKRADIKVLYGAWQIPVEIKRDSHKDLWKAIREQLIAKYSREASSDGYGIYLVFWFGQDQMPPAADGGHKPKTAQELQQRLAATVPKKLQHKIAVLVIDCTKPSQR